MNQNNADINKHTILKFIRSTELLNGIDITKLEEVSDQLHLQSLEKDTPLYKQGDSDDSLYFVFAGRLRSVLDIGNHKEKIVEFLEKGDSVGDFVSVVGGTHATTVYADCKSIVVKMPTTCFAKLVQDFPESLHRMTEILKNRLRNHQLHMILPNLFGRLDSKIVDTIQSHIKWVHLKSGQTLYHREEEGSSFCIVINGRLAAFVKGGDGKEKKVGEISPGESVGEMAMLTGDKRTANVTAVRDTELVLFSKDAFYRITKRYPQLLTAITQLITTRLSRVLCAQGAETTVTNIAVVSINDDFYIEEFSTSLIKALSQYGSVLYLNPRRLDDMLGIKGAAQTTEENPSYLNLESWLDQQELNHRFIIYETDVHESPWSNRCLRQSDCVFLVADAAKGPSAGKYQAAFEKHHRRSAVPYTLVLCHSNREHPPTNTGKWKSLLHFHSHHHIVNKCEKDFERLARFLTGQTIGLVLGGGGARGFAHIGVLQALEEAGIPVDIICGTSMGALISSLYAVGKNTRELIALNKKIWLDMKPLKDYTIPLVSFMKDRRFKTISHMLYNDMEIEDLWLNYFCISSNLTTSEMMVHRTGALGKAVRASVAIPGITLPVIDKGHLLADGGMLNNLPGDVLKDMYGGTIIAVNVSSEEDLSFSSNEIPSPWKIIWSRITPFKKSIKCFNILDVMTRATLLSSVHRSKEVRSQVDLYLEPPVSHFGLLKFSAIDDIVEIGYSDAKEKIAAWKNHQNEPSHPFIE